MMPPLLPRPWVHTELRGREPPLPPPLSVRLRILPCQSVGQVHFSVALLQVLLMQLTDMFMEEEQLQWSRQPVPNPRKCRKAESTVIAPYSTPASGSVQDHAPDRPKNRTAGR